MDRPYWCPVCHRRVEIPDLLRTGNIKLGEGGKVEVACGNCGKGKVTVEGLG